MTAYLVDHDQMHAELLILKNNSIKAEKDTINEPLEEIKVSEATEFSSANPILSPTKIEDQPAEMIIEVKKTQVQSYSAAFMTS